MNQYQDSNFEDDFEDDKLSEEDIADSYRFRDFVEVCPNCKQSITPDMDSCPFCGDILFRNLKDSTFAPRKGPLVKVFAAIIILLVTMAMLGLLVHLFLW